MPENDPLAEATSILATAVGTDELALRRQMGNAGYEAYRGRLEVIQGLAVDKERHQTDLMATQVRYLAAKTAFWSILTATVILIGIAASVATIVVVVR